VSTVVIDTGVIQGANHLSVLLTMELHLFCFSFTNSSKHNVIAAF